MSPRRYSSGMARRHLVFRLRLGLAPGGSPSGFHSGGAVVVCRASPHSAAVGSLGLGPQCVFNTIERNVGLRGCAHVATASCFGERRSRVPGADSTTFALRDDRIADAYSPSKELRLPLTSPSARSLRSAFLGISLRAPF